MQWTLPIGGETNMWVANSNVANLTSSETVVKRFDTDILCVLNKVKP